MSDPPDSRPSPPDDSPGPDQETPSPSRMSWGKPLLLTAVVALAGVLYWQFGSYLSFERAAAAEAQLRQFVEENPLGSALAASVVYILVTALSLPGALFLTLIVGWMFQFWKGLLIVSFSSTIGATLAFILARYLFRDAIRGRFGDRLHSFERNLQRDGPFYLFSLRLIPAVPFFVVNIVMALTPIAAATFYWVSQIGMLPGTAAFVYAGSAVDLQRLAEDGPAGLVSWQLLAAFAVVGLLPVLIRKLLARFGPGVPNADA